MHWDLTLLIAFVQVLAAFAAAVSSAGPIDVLVCNAGISVPGARQFSEEFTIDRGAGGGREGY